MVIHSFKKECSVVAKKNSMRDKHMGFIEKKIFILLRTP